MRLALALVVALVMSLSAGSAEAKKGLLIFNTGEELFEVGPFPEKALAADPQLAADKLIVGVVCSRFGLFWADVWTWNCHFVGTPDADSNSVATLSDPVLTLVQEKYSLSDAKRGIWNRFMFWLLLFAGVGFVVYSQMTSKGGEDEEDDEAGDKSAGDGDNKKSEANPTAPPAP